MRFVRYVFKQFYVTPSMSSPPVNRFYRLIFSLPSTSTLDRKRVARFCRAQTRAPALHPSMPETPLKTGSPRPVDERQPLLESRIPNAHSKAQIDPEAASQTDQPEAESVVRKASFQKVFWCIFFVSLAGIVFAGVVNGFIKNGDVEVCAAPGSLWICRSCTRYRSLV